MREKINVLIIYVVLSKNGGCYMNYWIKCILNIYVMRRNYKIYIIFK